LKESKQKIIDIVGEAYGKELTISIKPK
jgi:hypothetical protein